MKKIFKLIMTIAIIGILCSRLWGWTSDYYKIGSGTHRTSFVILTDIDARSDRLQSVVNWVSSNPLANGRELNGTIPMTPAHGSLLLPYSYHGNIYLNEDEYYEPPKPPIIPIPAIIPLQAIAGVITGLGGWYPGMISAMHIHNAIRPAKRCDIPEAYFGSMIVGGLVGFSMGAPVGIWAVGKCFGLEGSFGKTFRGSLIGSVGITATTILITRTIELPELIATVMSGSIIGGFLGFYVKTERGEEIK